MASYRNAVQWIADNDDTDLGEPESPIVSICLVADIFGKEPEAVHHDVTERRRLDERGSRRVARTAVVRHRS